MALELRRFTWMIGLVLLAQGTLPALAGLGGGVDSVQADGSHMKARVKAAVQGAGYTVQELQLPSGTTVQEYVAPGGAVFGVSWSGPTMPDLRQIFGSYYEQYLEASSAAPHNGATRRHFAVSGADLVVQSSGRMRHYFGRAYVPSLFPSGVSTDVIQ
ncbi:MAG: DUF2844 domain-containing protein [Steroidobacteraceae bacterium]